MYALADQQGWNAAHNWALNERKNVYTNSLFLLQYKEKLPVSVLLVPLW